MAALLALSWLRRRSARRPGDMEPAAPLPSRASTSKSTVKTENNSLKKCRICLGDGKISIFEKKKSKCIADDIRIFGNVEVSEDDHLPKTVCEDCSALLQAAVLFRQMAQDTDRVLRSTPETKTEPENSHNFCLNDDEIDWDNDNDSEKEEKIDVFHCQRCQIDFPTPEEFFEHRKTDTHIKARVRCEVCQAVCASRYLKIHMTRFHSTIQPYICDVCGKSFPVKGSFERHRMIHTDKLPFKCAECPYRGRFKESLKMHMRSHTGEKPYACDQCPARFLNASNLKKHSRTHQSHFDYKCDQCDRGFYTLPKLREHFRIDHTGLKEHKCPVCGKEFAYRKQMMKHSRKVHHRAKQQSGRLPLYIQIDKKLQEERRNYEHEVN